MSDEKLLTTEELAEAFNLPLNTMVRYRAKGGGPVFRKIGNGINGSVRYDAADVRKWLDTRKAGSIAQGISLSLSK